MLADLGKRLNANLDPSSDRVVTIELDGVLISLESPEQSSFMYFHAPVRRLSAEAGSEYTVAMRRNLFGLPMTGAWLAADAETDELILCHSAPLAETTEDRLIASIEAVASAVNELRNEQNLGRSPRHLDALAGTDFIVR